MKKTFIIILALCALIFCSCTGEIYSQINIVGGERITLEVGSSFSLSTDVKSPNIEWSATGSACTVDENGKVTAIDIGKSAITATLGTLSDTVLFEVVEKSVIADDAEKREFYEDYEVAQSHGEALERSKQGLMSGYLTVPDQAPVLSPTRPTENGSFIRNSETCFEDENTYTVVDWRGEEVLTVYRGGAYITLEEVAAYVYAFGDVPANYVSGKDVEPESSIWGEYLRLNHSAFSGNTEKYPYEPELPNISGCGGELYYYEIDIGTTGTDCDPRYVARTYNDGQTVTRGAARIVYTRYDKNKDQIIDPDEKYVFYTYNHYNDFCEYLNYYGGWGETFGNVTGGGTISSKTDYSPTPYPESVRKPLSGGQGLSQVFIACDIYALFFKERMI